MNIPISLVIKTSTSTTDGTTTQPSTTTTQTTSGVPTERRYWPVPPPLLLSTYEYQDVGKDIRLRKSVTEFFQNKVIKWVKHYKEFEHLKPKLHMLESDEGTKKIYTVLRRFIKNSNINWFDLKDNYTLIKEYLRKNL